MDNSFTGKVEFVSYLGGADRYSYRVCPPSTG